MKTFTKFSLAMSALAALAAAAIVSHDPARAVTGTPPILGPALQDGIWLNGLASGQNLNYLYGITAAGTTQAGATALTPGSALYEVDTTPGSSGVSLPQCFQGQGLWLYNFGSNTLTVYPNPTNNPTTSAQDTINNTTTLSLSAHTPEFFGCAKTGNWFAK